MVIAVTRVRMMQMAVYQVIHVVAVRHRFMAAARAVHVLGIVTAASVAARARRRIGSRDFNHVLVIVAIVRMMQMAVVQVVHVVAVLHGRMSAVGAVFVSVVGVCVAGHFIFLCEVRWGVRWRAPEH